MSDTYGMTDTMTADAATDFDALTQAIRTTANATDTAAHAAALVLAEYAAHDENTSRDFTTAGNTIAFRSITRDVGVWANCHGINHSDTGEIVTHDRCGAEVVVRDDGRIFDVIRVGTYAARKFQCWRGQHQCEAHHVAATAAARAADVASGNPAVKGANVEVFKGRKVPKGITGQVFWVGEDNYSGKPKIGIRTADGTAHFLLAEHCKTV